MVVSVVDQDRENYGSCRDVRKMKEWLFQLQHNYRVLTRSYRPLCSLVERVRSEGGVRRGGEL